MFQLPAGVSGDAVGVLFYSFFCLLCNILLTWLSWIYNERTSYVACISYLALLAAVSSIISQFYDLSNWEDLSTAQFYHVKANPDDAEVQYQKGVTGFKLVMAYIRLYCFIAETTMVFFLALTLAASVKSWWSKRPEVLRFLAIFGKVFALLAAVISTALLHTPLAWQSFTAYMVIANFQFILSAAGSIAMLVVILAKYVQTRRLLNTWRVQYPRKRSARSGTQGTKESQQSGKQSAAVSKSSVGSTDNWLVVRLTFALIMLCVFGYTKFSSHLSAHRKVASYYDRDTPELSAKAARSSVRGYLQGVSPSLVLFIVFGTTKTFRQKLWKTFVPRRWRKEEGMQRLPDQVRESQRRSSFPGFPTAALTGSGPGAAGPVTKVYTGASSSTDVAPGTVHIVLKSTTTVTSIELQPVTLSPPISPTRTISPTMTTSLTPPPWRTPPMPPPNDVTRWLHSRLEMATTEVRATTGESALQRQRSNSADAASSLSLGPLNRKGTVPTAYPSLHSPFKSLANPRAPVIYGKKKGRSMSVDELGNHMPNFSRKYSPDTHAEERPDFAVPSGSQRPTTSGSANPQEVRKAFLNAWRSSVAYEWADEGMKDLETGRLRSKISLPAVRSKFNNS